MLLAATDVVFEGRKDQFIGTGALRQTFPSVTFRFACCGEIFAQRMKNLTPVRESILPHGVARDAYYLFSDSDVVGIRKSGNAR